MVKKQQFDEAYTTLLKKKDDLYLLRMAIETKPQTKNLELETCRQVLFKLNRFVRSQRSELLGIAWIEDSADSGKFMQLDKQDQNEYLDTLYQIKEQHYNQKLKERAH